VRYIGKLTTADLQAEHHWYGIELDGRWRGTGNCDGRHNGQRHFECRKNCGLFVKRDEIVSVIRRRAEERFLEHLSSREKIEMIFSTDYTSVNKGISALRKFLDDMEEKQRETEKKKKRKKKSRINRLNPGPVDETPGEERETDAQQNDSN